MQGDGNLVLYNGGTALWSTGTAGDSGASVTMQGDGNLVIYENGVAKWSSGTAGFSGAYLALQDDSNLVVYQGSHALWARGRGYLGFKLSGGVTLSPGQVLLSPSRAYRLIMQGDGNLVLYQGGSALWSSGTAGDPGATATMQTDGNLVIYDNGVAKWSSGTAGFSGAYLALQDDSNLVVYHGAHPVWDWSAGYLGNKLTAGTTLVSGGELLSPSHRYRLIMQGDGNLVLYNGGTALWSTGTAGDSGASVTMQGDGNLVVYQGGAAKWNSGTAGSPGAFLDLQNDSNLVIYQGSTALWDWESGRLNGGSSGGQAIVDAAASQAGRPYCFFGGNEYGPTHGKGNADGATQCGPESVVGFDCTGLTQYAVYQGTSGAVDLTHHDSEQAKYAPGRWITSESALQPGDVVYFGSSREDITHAAIYAGVANGQKMIWDADTAFWIYPDGVHERTLASENSLGFVGAARF